MQLVRNECIRVELEEFHAIDEQIIPSKTKLSKICQCNPKKPRKWGLKNLVHAGSSAMVYDFASIHENRKKYHVSRPAFEKVMIPDHQSNDIEHSLVLSPICQIWFSDLTGFNRSFLPVEIGDFLQKAPFENLKKGAETASKISLPSNNDSWMCSCIVSSWENGIPLNK